MWPTTRSFAAVVEAEDQRADRALLLARAPADDDAVGGAQPLDLDHPLALARPVGGVELLRDHALAGLEPGLGLFGRARQRGQLDRAGVLFFARRARDQRLERSRRSSNGSREQLLVALGEQVEGAEQRRRLLGQHPIRDSAGWIRFWSASNSSCPSSSRITSSPSST